MAINRFLNIQIALDTTLAAVVGAPTIIWENGPTVNMALSSSYWRPTTLPANADVAQADMLQRHTGIYQVDIFVPANRGMTAVKGYYDSIYTAFNSSDNLIANTTKVSISDINQGRIEQDDHGWCKGFLEINYECYSY